MGAESRNPLNSGSSPAEEASGSSGGRGSPRLLREMGKPSGHLHNLCGGGGGRGVVPFCFFFGHGKERLLQRTKMQGVEEGSVAAASPSDLLTPDRDPRRTMSAPLSGSPATTCWTK